MTFRRTAPVADTAAARQRVLVARCRAAFEEADTAEAARLVRRVMPDGTVVVGVAEAPPAPPPPPEVMEARERVAALRARLAGGAFRPLR
jgi:hypothetical protein